MSTVPNGITNGQFGPYKFLASLSAVGLVFLSFGWLMWNAQQAAIEERILCRQHLMELRDEVMHLREELRKR
jgi:hypothetical protein